MNSYFENITQEEYDLLKEAVFNVSILIAGADGKIEEEEKEWAEKITHIREYSGPEVLRSFYADLSEKFEEHLDAKIKALPQDVEERNVALAESLRNLNPILAKLPQTVGASYYESLTSLAKHVAKASGGIMRIWAISKEEANWIELPMITPISFPEIEE